MNARLGPWLALILLLVMAVPVFAGPRAVMVIGEPVGGIDRSVEASSGDPARWADAAEKFLAEAADNRAPCANVMRPADVRALVEWERQKQLLGAGDENALLGIAGAMGVDTIIMVQTAVIGGQVHVTARSLDVAKAKPTSYATTRLPAGERGVDQLENFQQNFVESIPGFCCPGKSCGKKYHFRGVEKIGRFEVITEGFSREGLYGTWDVTWLATAVGDGVTTEMEVDEIVMTSFEPDNLGSIEGKGTLRQRMQWDEMEVDRKGTITVKGTATINGSQDQPTITLTMSEFNIDSSGAGSLSGKTYADKATMSGAKGSMSAQGASTVNGRRGGQLNIESPFAHKPKTFDIEVLKPGQSPPPKPAAKQPGKDGSESSDDDWARDPSDRPPPKKKAAPQEDDERIDTTYDPDDPDSPDQPDGGDA